MRACAKIVEQAEKPNNEIRDLTAGILVVLAESDQFSQPRFVRLVLALFNLCLCQFPRI